MKKIIFGAVFISMVTLVSAQTPLVCVDLPSSLARGAESKNVLAVQNFLFTKGILKAKPNGYFGPGTFAAVKAYQKSIGLAQVGNVGPGTRAAIKQESCNSFNTVNTVNTVNKVNSVDTVNTVAHPIATTTPVVSVPATVTQNLPRPVINSFDFVTLFAGGETDWGFNMYGSNFSTSTNSVSFRNINNRRTYAIGTFASASGTVIVLPKNMTGTAYSCGTNCQEELPAGRYEVTVTTGGGQSEIKTLDIQSFTISAQTGALQSALPAKATGSKFGTLSFSPSQAVVLRAVNLQFSTSTISSSGLGTVAFKDEMTGNVLTYDQSLSGFQSMIIDAYVDTDNKIPGTVNANFVVEVEDYIGKKRTKFISPTFLVTVAGIL